MKELILALVGVVIIALIMEMFCPQNHLKSVIMSAFSLVTIFVILSGLKSFIDKDYKTNYNLNENITYSLEIISESSTKYMEEQILNVCKKEGVDNIEKAEWYYAWGQILEEQGNKQTAAFRYKSAVSLNPNFGNALYRLALMYSENKLYPKDALKDSYRYLLCVDKMERAKECIQQYGGSATMGKYNTVSINTINGYIASFKSMCPDQAEAFMLGAEFSTPGKKYTFPGGVMKGETTIIRFY